MEWAVTGGGESAVKEPGTQKWGSFSGEVAVSLLHASLPAVIWSL